MKTPFLLFLATASLILAQESPKETTQENANKQVQAETPENKTPAKEQKKKITDNSRVSVLGYHDFSSKKKQTQMRIRTSKFRKQMKEIRDRKFNVLTLDEFLKWKRGEATVPDRSILITIDDGWKSVYTEAYPILKEYNLPFTVFLYKRYVDGGGRALSTKMIKEMMENGCTIGSHSVDHPYPSKVRRNKRKGKKAYNAYLKVEFGDSKVFLEEKFGQPVTTYAYPGGFYTEEMFSVAKDLGYEFLFTVKPGKVTQESPNHILKRHIILGTHDSTFRNSLTFKKRATPLKLDSKEAIEQLKITVPHPVSPAPAEKINSRTPTISIDLSKVTTLNPSSIELKVGGFGIVPHTWDKEKKTASWTLNRPLAKDSCNAEVRWKLQGGKKYEMPIKWTFLVDKTAAYAPKKAK